MVSAVVELCFPGRLTAQRDVRAARSVLPLELSTLVQCLALAVGPACALAPLALPIILFLLGCAGLRDLVSSGRTWRTPINGIALVSFAAFAWLCLSGLWSPVPTKAGRQIVQFLLILAPSLLAFRYVIALQRPAAAALSKVVAASVLMGAAVLTFEFLGGQKLHRLWLCLVNPGTNAFAFSIGEIDVASINRPVTVIGVLLFPLSLAAERRFDRATAFAMLSVWLVISFFSTSQAAFLGMAAGILAALCTHVAPRLARNGILAAVAVSLASVVPLSLLNHETGFAEKYLSSGVFEDACVGQRSEMYYAASTVILEKPIAGHGLESSCKPQTILNPRTGESMFYSHHPHNFALQVLLESGFVGGAFFVILTALVLRRLAALSRDIEIWTLGAITASVTMASFSIGLWQSWWLSSIALVVVTLALECRVNAPAAEHGV